MPGFCLIPAQVDKFKAALSDGTIDPYKLNKLSSEERHGFFSKIVGEDNATGVNSLFESRILLKSQKYAYTAWAKRVAGITPAVRRDMLSKIERMDHILNPTEEQQFLHDLAETRLGFGVTQEEAKTIADMSKNIVETRAKANEVGIFKNDADRLAYGAATINLENYVNDAKLQARKLSIAKNPIKSANKVAREAPGILKSMVSALDDSFFGRQGIATLLNIRTSHIWIKNIVKSIGDIGRQLVADSRFLPTGIRDVMDVIKADIYSRPNAINGKYKAGNYGLHVLSEEAYPSSLPEKIPLFGRLFKASEAAYNGGALRMRADLADRYIKIAEKQGINTLDKTQAEGLGTLIGSMTGRGSLNSTNSLANSLLFSVKFLKGNFDSLTLHTFDKKATAFTRKEAAKNLLGMVISVGSILEIAHAMDPTSVDLDARSPNFGKIKVFGHWTDITGGRGALLTLAARTVVPTRHNGQLGLWGKSKTGVFTNLTEGGFGKQTALDVADSFWQGKLSPAAGLVRDQWAGKNYSGEKPTLKNELPNVTVPISIQTFQQLKDSKNADKLGAMIMDGLGFSVNTNPMVQPSAWENSTSMELKTFKQRVGQTKFNQAAKQYSTELSNSLKDLYANPDFNKESDTDKQRSIDKRKAEAKAQVLSQYNFKYKAPKSHKVL